MWVYQNCKQFRIWSFYLVYKQLGISTYFVEYLFYNHLFTHSKCGFSKCITKSCYHQFQLRLQVFIHLRSLASDKQ